MPYVRHLFGQLIFLLGSIFALVGTPFVLVGLHLGMRQPLTAPVFVALGLLFGGTGWFLVAKAVARTRSAIALFESGFRVPGKVLEVKQDLTTEINGRNPWFLRYSFTGPDGRVYEDSSDYLPRGTHDRWQAGAEIMVACDPADPARHAVDVMNIRSML